MKKLPVYKLKIKETDEETGVFAIALVDAPAIEIDWFAFDKNKEQSEFKFVSQEKKMLAGYFLVPDKLIYRRDISGEYFVQFDAETIEKISEKFNKKQFGKNFNIGHNDNNKTQAFVKENWMITSAEFDKSKEFGFEPIVGAWFGIVKVEDDLTWNGLVKEGKINGFSVEGFFEMELSEAVSKFAEQINLDKIGFDYDETLSTSKGKELAKEYLSKNDDVYIITARQSDNSESVYSTANELGIPHSRVYFTNGADKWEKVKELGLDKFYDNNQEQITKINDNTNTEGIKFADLTPLQKYRLKKKEIDNKEINLVIEPETGETEEEFIGRCVGIEINNGYPQDQALAMCYAKWRKE